MYYFAYGSNMNLAHMRRLCGWNCRPLGPAKLDDFEFGLDQRGYNNMRPQPGQHVWGVLYEINEAALAAMDEFEGYPDVFNRTEVKPIDDSGHKLTAWAYMQTAENFGSTQGRPDHIKHILIGARENGLPEQWIKKLEGFLPK